MVKAMAAMMSMMMRVMWMMSGVYEYDDAQENVDEFRNPFPAASSP